MVSMSGGQATPEMRERMKGTNVVAMRTITTPQIPKPTSVEESGPGTSVLPVSVTTGCPSTSEVDSPWTKATE
jgi:hypothetical protein